MLPSSRAVRRATVTTIGIGAVAAATLFGSVPSALADPPPPPAPGCSAADFEQLHSAVAAATADYLFIHPDVNAYFSSLKGQPKDQVRNQINAYLDNNPQAKSDLAGIRQPLHDMKARCE
jgi:hemophore-related protein